jgi:transcriptional regulator GlxA family with amidase domain
MRTLIIILRMSVFTGSANPLKINVLILPDTSVMCLAAILEPMRAVNRITGQNLFDRRTISLNGGSVELSCGITICADEKFSPNLNGDLLLLMDCVNQCNSGEIRVSRRGHQHDGTVSGRTDDD